MPKKVEAIVDWSLHTNCPVCGEHVDLEELDSNHEGEFARILFSGNWKQINKELIECPECEAGFRVDDIKY